jgi:hypothetical protein
VQSKFFVSNWHKDLLFFNVDVVTIVIHKGRAQSPHPDFLLTGPFDDSGFALGVLVVNEEVRSLFELADDGGEDGLAFGGPLGEQPDEAEGDDGGYDEEPYFYLRLFQGQGCVDRGLGRVGIVKHPDLEGRVIVVKDVHAF